MYKQLVLIDESNLKNSRSTNITVYVGINTGLTAEASLQLANFMSNGVKVHMHLSRHTQDKLTEAQSSF